MNELEKDLIRLKHIVQAIDAINEFVDVDDFKEFKANKLLQSAVVRQLEIIGEAPRNLSESTKAKAPQVPWEAISGLRNLLIHEYFHVDLITIWESYLYDLPDLKQQVETLLDQLDDTGKE